MRLGINNAQAIRDVLLNSSEQALADQQNQQLTQSFCDVVDAIIAGGGMVGGLGDRFTRVAAAHAVHNGLTVLPQTEKFLHGTKVAYGILVQSALLGQDDVLAQLTGAYQRFHLPTTLAELEWISIIRRDRQSDCAHLASGGIHSLSASHADTRYLACSVRKSGIV